MNRWWYGCTCSSEIVTRRLSPQLRVYPYNPRIFRILDRCTCLQLFPTYTKHIRTIYLYIYIYNVYIYIYLFSPSTKHIYIWVVVSNIFYFYPYLGKKSNLTNIFQMGWTHPIYTCMYTNMLVFCFNKTTVGFSPFFKAQTAHCRYRGLGALWHQRTQRGSRPSKRGGVWWCLKS